MKGFAKNHIDYVRNSILGLYFLLAGTAAAADGSGVNHEGGTGSNLQNCHVPLKAQSAFTLPGRIDQEDADYALYCSTLYSFRAKVSEDAIWNEFHRSSCTGKSAKDEKQAVRQQSIEDLLRRNLKP
jgi:hypothetical protein